MVNQNNNNKERIIVFDTTLRDGEQASGFHMFSEEKLEIARKLEELNVNVIEAGFAASSPGDFEAIHKICEEITKAKVCSLARARDEDIEIAAKALEPAIKRGNARIHTFIATSDIHIEKKYNKDREWVLMQTEKAVKKAKSFVNDVEFSCEDFSRSDLDFVIKVVCKAIEAGATTINLPDTVGYMLPSESYEKIKSVIEKVKEKGYDAIFSVHNHNDLGLATANTLNALEAGARQIEVTINGIGERAGNAALEEIIAILKTRKLYYTNINTKLIGEISKLLSKIIGIEPQPNKAVVGKNAFAHEAGIHQDGMSKDRETYEIMKPEDYGMESVITFGARSGKNALKAKYQTMNIKLSDVEFEKAANAFTLISDKVKEADDADVIRAIKDKEISEYYQFISYHPIVDEVYGIIVKVKRDEKIETLYGEGNGQIDAAINAIRKIVQKDYKLEEFRVISKAKGSDAKGLTIVKVSKNGWNVIGIGESTDVVTASIKAFINACNRLKYIEDYFASVSK